MNIVKNVMVSNKMNAHSVKKDYLCKINLHALFNARTNYMQINLLNNVFLVTVRVKLVLDLKMTIVLLVKIIIFLIT
jgi:hypothetical protein